MKRDLGALVRLLQLASPALPVGAYSYSQGLEAAVEAGLVKDAAGAERWIGEVLSLSVASLEAPLLARLMAAFAADDPAAASRWNDEFLASRESAELRAETVQMGYSLRRLAKELDFGGAGALEPLDEVSFPAAFAAVANAWAIAPEDAVTAYLWAWIENQVMAALKAVPLGQTDGQRVLLALGDRLPAAVQAALALHDEDLANFAPGLALLSSRHETQYSRLFRS
ncbi:MAG: urease accessory protein UreF [Betaproteobacteria bacterium]|nr:urease accessory protein UreF [Betaproteobacteria bacterium]